MIRRLSNRSGSALVSTMLVIAVLTIIVVAFLQSMTVEQKTARSYLNKYRAELAAQAAANRSETLIQDLFKRYPDSCTAWSRFPNTQGTTFYYRALTGTDSGSLPSNSDAEVELKALPLVSGAISQKMANLTESTAYPSGLTPANSVDLNLKGWIGGPTDATTQPIRAQWINILEDPLNPEDLTFDASKGRAKNGPLARYAFWIEDESLRVNVNTAGATPRGDSTTGSSPKEIAMQAVTEAAGVENIADSVVALREKMPNKQLLSASEVNYAKDSETDYGKLKFYITDQSSGLNLSRGGVKRLDLNTAIADSVPPDPVDIRKQLDRIIAAFTNKYAMPPRTGSPSKASDFGQRFFNKNGLVASLDRTDVGIVNSSDDAGEIYMQKIAANIRDYIDTDFQPTIIENEEGYPVRPTKPPTANLGDENNTAIGANVVGNGSATSSSDTAAIGKEAVPSLQEYALRITLKKFDVTGTGKTSSASYAFDQDHYFEFLNPTNKPIKGSDLGPNAFLLIFNQFPYNTDGGTPILEGRPMKVYLKDLVNGTGTKFDDSEIPAGGILVLTTDGNPNQSIAYSAKGVSVNSFFRPSPGALGGVANRTYEGITKRLNSNNKPRLEALLGSNVTNRGGSSSTDYATCMLLGNDYGVIESFTALPTYPALSIHNDDKEMNDPSTHFFRGGSLRGNSDSLITYQTGDPRSLNEQMSIARYIGGANAPADQTRFSVNELDKNDLGPQGDQTFTMGYFANVPAFVNPAYWPDYTPVITDAATATARIANAKLNSIGQLGDVYDPVRSAGPTSITLARGGGRTFRIGQAEGTVAITGTGPPPPASRFGLWNNSKDAADPLAKEINVSRNRAAWRMTDIFSVDSKIETPGLININGVGRDKGVALKAALYQLKFNSNSGENPALSGKELNVNALIEAISKSRFPSINTNSPEKDRPFWERGEISEIQADETLSSARIFSEGSTVAGKDLRSAVDRSREELVRRTMDLITTKGNIYRTYCIGQAVSTDRNGKIRVLAQKTLRETFSVEPTFDPPLPEDDSSFDPKDVEIRFRQPESYSIKNLSSSNE